VAAKLQPVAGSEPVHRLECVALVGVNVPYHQSHFVALRESASVGDFGVFVQKVVDAVVDAS
jgi:hypothetical protein